MHFAFKGEALVYTDYLSESVHSLRIEIGTISERICAIRKKVDTLLKLFRNSLDILLVRYLENLF